MGSSGFALTPHKISVCVLLFHVYAAGAGSMLPIKIRQKLAFFLLQLSKASDGFLEPTLEDLEAQLKQELGELGELVSEQLASRLLTLTSPDDLFTFCNRLRDMLIGSPYCPEDDEPLSVEHTSVLGQFLRRCILSFNILSFEGTCRLLAELDFYRRPVLSSSKEHIIPKDFFLNPSDEEAEEDDEENAEDEEDENFERGATIITPAQGRERIGNSRRAFGVPLVSTEGNEEFQMQELPGMQELEGFGASQSGNGGVQDGGFAFAFGDAASRGEPSSQGSFLRTHGQVETYMRDQAVLIFKELGDENKGGLDTKLSQIEKLAPDMHRVHYLQYLNSVHHEDYPAAMSRLHQYFDFSAGRGSNGSGTDTTAGRFQTGLLTLGSLHSHFGHVTHALQALSETVRIAQQNNDDSCLAYALAALCHLLAEVGVAAELTVAGTPSLESGSPLAIQQQLLLSLKRCLKRALELKLPDLVAFSRLALAKFDLQHVRRLPQIGGLKSCEQLGTSPIEVCKTLRLSPYLFSDFVLNTLPGQGANSRPLPGKLGSISEAIVKLAGTSHLLRACSWEVYGSNPMMRASTLVHAYCYSKASSAGDLSLAYVKLARHLASHKGYAVAIAALEKAKNKFPLHARASIRSVQLQFVHAQALYRGNLKLAWVACSELSAMASPVVGVDMDLKVESSYRHILTLLASAKFPEAAVAAGELFALCYKYDMQLDVVRVLLLIAEIHKKSGSSVSGVPYVLASITLCQSLNLDLLHAASRVSLAELWLGLGVDHAERALKLLHQCLPFVLGHGDLELRARTNLCIARCYLSTPDFPVASKQELVLRPLSQAAEEFIILEDKDRASEAFYLQAITYDALGQFDERDKAAAMYQQCLVELNQAQESEDAILTV